MQLSSETAAVLLINGVDCFLLSLSRKKSRGSSPSYYGIGLLVAHLSHARRRGGTHKECICPSRSGFWLLSCLSSPGC